MRIVSQRDEMVPISVPNKFAPKMKNQKRSTVSTPRSKLAPSTLHPVEIFHLDAKRNTTTELQRLRYISPTNVLVQFVSASEYQPYRRTIVTWKSRAAS